MAAEDSSRNEENDHQDDDAKEEAFPWHIGIYDAHCHPTDSMSHISNISSMHAAGLTIMSTREQDQDLVTDISSSSRAAEKVIPSFGWHPWFSHRLLDDSSSPLPADYRISGEQKRSHYDAVLRPSPVDEPFLTSLPDPLPLSAFLAATRERMRQRPDALLGEVGLDKSFRLPSPFPDSTPAPDEHEHDNENRLTPGGREGRPLSKYRVTPAHQIAVLKAQLNLAAEMQRAVSVHGVRATGYLCDVFEGLWKPRLPSKKGKKKREDEGQGKGMSRAERKRAVSVDGAHDGSSDEEGAATNGNDARSTKEAGHSTPAYPPRVCLHSYGGDSAFLARYFARDSPIKFFASYSLFVNFSDHSNKFARDSVAATPDDRLLVESDLHVAGAEMDEVLERVTRLVCKIKGWGLEEGVLRLKRNWRAFVYGDEGDAFQNG